MLSKAVGLAGGLYVARKYLRDRLEEVKEKSEVERAAREQSVLQIPSILSHILIIVNSLRRRFHQTQDDASYTVLALLPTLSEQVVQTMDVEVLINELQSRSKSRKNAFPSSNPPGPSLQPPQYPHNQATRQLTSSLSSNITIINNPLDEDSRSEASSVRLSQTSDDHDLLSSHISGSPDGVQSWIKTEPISPAPSTSAPSSIAEDNRYTDGRLEASGVDYEPLVRI
jgi:peroxin-3